MNESLLRQFVREALIAELHRDHKFIAMLTGSGVRKSDSKEDRTIQTLVDEWIHDVESELGHRLQPRYRAVIAGFVKKRWKMLLQRFRGNMPATKQTVFNLLDARFHGLRPAR